MKKINHLLLAIFIIVISTYNVSAATNPYKQTGPYGTNCTWYAWKMAYEKAKVTLPGWGNAKQWYSDAQKSGYKVGTTPKANSIVVWGGWTSYGHVGYVESVEGNTLNVWDSTGPCIDETDPEYIQCRANSYSEDDDKICKEKAKRTYCKYTISPDEYGITGYIYLDYTPKKETTNKTNQVTTKEPVQEVKSNNANLSNIELSEETINFNKDITEYGIIVPNKIDKIIINAIKEDEKATIEGNGEYKLKEGKNEIKITVTAEDGTKKEYTLKITREKKKVVKKEKQEKKQNLNLSMYIKCISVFICTITLIVLIKKLKKHKN